MSDISKCSGLSIKDHKAIICPLRNNCKRFLAQSNDYQQSWIEPKFKGEECENLYKKT